MSRTLIVCLASLLATPALAQERNAPNPDAARVEVHKGRAAILSQGRPERTLNADETASTQGKTHLEVGAGSEVRLSWPGRASMHVWGPASLQWEPQQGTTEGRGQLDTFSSNSLEWHLFDVAWVDVEVRRGNHVMRLPGDWRADVGNGAFHLRGIPAGPLEVRHHAGRPLTLTWVGDETQARPPISIYAGSSVRLDLPPTSRPDGSKNAGAWAEDREEWPWRNESVTLSQERRRRQMAGETQVFEGFPNGDPASSSPVARVREFDPETRVQVDVKPHAEPLAPRDQSKSTTRRSVPVAPQSARESQPLRLEVRPRIEPVQPRSEDAQAAPPSQPVRRKPVTEEVTEVKPSSRALLHADDHWRGLTPEQLNGTGPLAVERALGVEVRVFASGRRKVFVDVMAPGAAWCFGPDRDYLLHPGAVAVFEDDGSLRMKFGKIEQLPTIPGRPSFDMISR